MANLTKHQLEQLKKGLLDRQQLLTDEVKEKRERTASEGTRMQAAAWAMPAMNR